MNDFDFYSPTYFVFGRGREAEAGTYVKKFGGSRVLVLYGGQSAKRSGLLDRVLASLNGAGLHTVELGGVKPNPRSGLVYEGIDLCRKEGIDFLLAVGGGSVIDTAKAIAIGVPYEGDFWDFFSGKVPEKALPVGTVLTIAASGSEGSPDSIITNEKTLDKNSAEADCLRPCFSILDPALTESLPPYQTACGVTDIMAHAFERYFTNTEDVEVTDRLLEGVLLTMLHEGPRVMADPHDYGARANIMWAGMVCHNDMMGVGRKQDWNSHHLEHVLSALYDCAHGAGLAVIMPAWMRYCADHHDGLRMAQMAVRVFGCQMDFADPRRTALEGIAAFRAFLKSMGMPLTFAEIGADPADIPKLVEMNHVGGGVTGGYVGLTSDAIREIYEIAAGLRD
ncbi:iron-containing alcohol dehydrogenase [Oscillibacter valericigenes]|uniref:iron-containing alcohol dehydrogenase n=1 Tax=Oscillibacter valericigenes TaxID=351091 RepID=UPI001958BE1F|nr:iron-containing alcohol dehydrogenase [Oscillibacter valericigenes]MBM6909148.1 iron-containing alcohol dehydrogenase [Oscillibacter valericigenes]